MFLFSSFYIKYLFLFLNTVTFGGKMFVSYMFDVLSGKSFFPASVLLFWLSKISYFDELFYEEFRILHKIRVKKGKNAQ